MFREESPGEVLALVGGAYLRAPLFPSSEMVLEPSTLYLLSTLAAAAPALLYVTLIYWVDRYEKEPGWLLAATFLWGAAPAVLLALLFSLLGTAPLYLLTGPDVVNTLGAIFVAPPVEELVKGVAVLAVFLMLRHEIDSLLDGIIYGAMVGMGFALVENVFYFVDEFNQTGLEGWRTLVLLRGVVFGLNHSLFTSSTGLGLAVGRFARRRWLRIVAPILGFTAAVALHTAHNVGATLGGAFCLILPFADWGGVFLLLLIIVWALWQERQWIRAYLKEEVALGTMTLRQYETACSGRARMRHRLTLLVQRGPRGYLLASRFYRHCSELAYKKHHFSLLQEEKSQKLTQELRATLVELGREL